jgi:flagellar basal body-associated protein FliL
MKKIIDFIKAKQKLLLIVIGIYIILRIFSIGILFFAFTIEADETYKDKEY